VHELDALLGGSAQDGLVLVDLDLDADRLEPDDVLVTHRWSSRARERAEVGRLRQGEGRSGRPSPLA
jgi:hypothetical protein